MELWRDYRYTINQQIHGRRLAEVSPHHGAERYLSSRLVSHDQFIRQRAALSHELKGPKLATTEHCVSKTVSTKAIGSALCRRDRFESPPTSRRTGELLYKQGTSLVVMTNDAMEFNTP